MVQIPVELDAPELNSKKETRIYYRQHTNPDGNVVWIATLPLPSDPYHMNHYTKKGFKLWPPGKEPGQGEVSALQGQVQELEDQAKALKESTAEDEGAKVALEAEVKALEEQASSLKAQVGEVKVTEGRISCPQPDCTVTVKTYRGLARHVSEKHGIK